MRTLVTHMFNEEYLLPWWLNHHKKYFDNGIIIDYASTDQSVEICRDLCPSWTIVQSWNTDFQAEAIDREVIHYEQQVAGWKMCLTITEFLVGDINSLMPDTVNPTVQVIPICGFYDWNPEGTLDADRALWDQIRRGVDHLRYPEHRLGRLLHNHSYINYSPGRHYSGSTTNDAVVFKYANAISSPEMVDRRLQIQHKIPALDRNRSYGWNHYSVQPGDPNQLLTLDRLEQLMIKSTNNYAMVSDLSPMIDRLVSLMK